MTSNRRFDPQSAIRKPQFMIPYIAIIKDSFRAAMQSYTLRTLLAVVTTLLLVLVPFGYTEMITGRISYREVRNWPGLLDRVYESAQRDVPSPGKHVWSLLDPALKKQVEKLYEQLDAVQQKLEEGEDVDEDQLRMQATQINALCQALHTNLDEELLADEDFYDAQAWEGIELGEEARDLVELDPQQMPERQIRRRNRLLLEAAFPIFVPRSPPVSVRPTYGGQPIDLFGRAEGNTKDAVIDWYRGYIGWMLDWPVSMTLVFVAIIATSGIMPRMFDPGSFSLLLSKPITRTRLFLTQFLGSCAFMLLISIYFTVGVWLIAVIRLGIWNPKVFLCIPLFTLMFVVYYSVSAFAGVLYRSSIISVFAAVMLFFLCFFVGLMKVWYDDTVVDAARLVHIVDTGDMLVASNDMMLRSINHYTFDEANREWKDIYVQEGFSAGPAERPIYDREGNQLLSVNTFGIQTLSVGRARDAWVRKQGALVPQQTIALLTEPDGSVLAVSRSGFYRLTGDALPEKEEPDGTPGEESEETAFDEQPAALPGADAVDDVVGETTEGPRGAEPGEDEAAVEAIPSNLHSANLPAEDSTPDDPPRADEGAADEDVPQFDASGNADGADAANDQSNELPADDDDDQASEGASENDAEPPPSDPPPADGRTSGDPPTDAPTSGESSEDDATSSGDEIPDAAPPGAPEFGGLDADRLREAFPFEFVGPDKLPLPVEPPMTVAIGPATSRIAVYANGQVASYRRNEKDEYVETARRDLPDGQEKAATIAVAGAVIVVARDNGEVFVLNATTLDIEQQFSPEGEVSARFATASQNGEWVALLFHNRRLWLYNTRDRKLQEPNIWTQGDISAVNFSGNRLMIVDRIARVREFELPSLRQTRVFTPKELPYLSESTEVLPGVEVSLFAFFRWFITPLYTVLPKPGELGWALNYLATGEQTQMGLWSRLWQRGESTSDERHQVRDPWRGIRSCTLFVIVMLVLSCWKIRRTEF